jgi:HPt (histidine-containing phosphotransfer) domain-containing protein
MAVFLLLWAGMDKLFAELSRIEGLDVWEALSRVGNNLDFLYGALRRFCEDFDGHLEDMRKALAEEDWKNYTIFIHAFKGALANIGAEDLRARAYELELASKGGDYDACRAGTGEMIGDMRLLRDSLSEALREG